MNLSSKVFLGIMAFVCSKIFRTKGNSLNVIFNVMIYRSIMARNVIESFILELINIAAASIPKKNNFVVENKKRL